jgi:hypothetical protein
MFRHKGEGGGKGERNVNRTNKVNGKAIRKKGGKKLKIQK